MTRSVASARTVAGQRYPATLSGLYFGNTTAGVGVASSTPYNSLTALTVEAWVNMFSYGSYTGRIVNSAGTNAGYNLQINSAGVLGFQVGNATSTATNNAGTVSMNQWVHVAGSWDGSNVRSFVNGTLQATTALSGGNTGATVALAFGNNTASGGNRGLIGVISELRISNIARYTASFSVPTTPYVSDSNTIGLFHFYEGTGTTTADSSSNADNGTLGGSTLPKWVPGYFPGQISARTVAATRTVA